MTKAKVEGVVGGVVVETEWFDTAWSAQEWAESHCTGKWRLIDGRDGGPGEWHEDGGGS